MHLIVEMTTNTLQFDPKLQYAGDILKIFDYKIKNVEDIAGFFWEGFNNFFNC